MTHLDIDTALGWRDRTVRDVDGEKIGSLGDVFLDSETDLPAWAGVRTGLFGRRESYLPLDEVAEDEDGDLRVPFRAEVVKDAPQIDPEIALTPEEERTLYRHYGREYGGARGPGTGAATAGPIPDDDAMTRSEEEVTVHEGEMRPAERVRLRKVLVTEHQKRTIPVQREVVALETDPPEGGEPAPEDRPAS
jgi:PRC-barrel domain/Domain of unknown function (DUF2382)